MPTAQEIFANHMSAAKHAVNAAMVEASTTARAEGIVHGTFASLQAVKKALPK